VHVSFVRSISMDAFKPAELARMDAGGNATWKRFWEAHDRNTLEGLSWDDSTIRERYEGEVGDEYKARLTAKVEGRDYVPGEEKKNATTTTTTAKSSTASLGGSRSGTPNSMASASRVPTSVSSNPLLKTASTPRSASPAAAALGTASLGRKAQNEAYFSRMGAENATRSEDLPPNQGGKFTGFGSDPFPAGKRDEGVLPGVDEFQKDPVAALTKGFGWLGGVVGKGVGDGLQKVSLSSS
jgi:ADP-ribosylation factor GTPase-activating protein 1